MSATTTTESKPSFFRRILRPFITGLLAIFPLVLTLGIVAWLAGFVKGFLGPDSLFGRLLGSIGLNFVTGEYTAYFLGLAVSLALIYFLGVLVQAGMKNRWNAFVDSVMDRLPFINTIYAASKQLIGMFGKKDASELKAMTPVICSFGGEGGTAVLALMPSPETIRIQGHDYYAVLIPTAPVPFGGALLYVPVGWVQPADFAVDGLLNVYMSMGVTSPHCSNAAAPCLFRLQ